MTASFLSSSQFQPIYRRVRRALAGRITRDPTLRAFNLPPPTL